MASFARTTNSQPQDVRFGGIEFPVDLIADIKLPGWQGTKSDLSSGMVIHFYLDLGRDVRKIAEKNFQQPFDMSFRLADHAGLVFETWRVEDAKVAGYTYQPSGSHLTIALEITFHRIVRDCTATDLEGDEADEKAINELKDTFLGVIARNERRMEAGGSIAARDIKWLLELVKFFAEDPAFDEPLL
jgi:hypothetical protein